VLVALGSGALKANASGLLGTLYEKGDPRCDSGFTVFYLGINIGAFVGPLVTGLLQSRVGFHIGFGVAAIGMAIGLAQYAVFRRNLGEHGRVVPNPLTGNVFGRLAGAVIAAGAVVVAAALTSVVTLANLSHVTAGVIATASVVYFTVLLTSAKVTRVERARVKAFSALFIANAVFWSLYQQTFTVLAVYSDERINWSIFGWTAPSSWIGAMSAVWVIVLAPVFAVVWTKLGNRAPSTPHKFAYGVGGIGVAFLLFLPMAALPGQSVPALFVVGIVAVFAVSELMISPIGLSVTTKLAPKPFQAQMMALLFLSVGLGTSMSGVLARYYDPAHEAAYFGALGAVAILVGAIMFYFAPRVTALMEGLR
jgi:POT family proton-dependent oligopeptide transporter